MIRMKGKKNENEKEKMFLFPLHTVLFSGMLCQQTPSMSFTLSQKRMCTRVEPPPLRSPLGCFPEEEKVAAPPHWPWNEWEVRS